MTDASRTPFNSAAAWAPLRGEPATLAVASWQTSSLTDVRRELERGLGVEFVASEEKVYDGEPAFACALPACELRLNCWPAANPTLCYFNLIGLGQREAHRPLAPAHDLSAATAEHLRRQGYDWYVPHVNEALENGGVLGPELLNSVEIASMLAPRWLGWTSGEDADLGHLLLEAVAELWVTEARRTAMRATASGQAFCRSVGSSRACER